MAFGQIDPARLQGDALKQWYLRSPADIEEERRQAAARAYDAFFSPIDGPQSDGGSDAVSAPAAASTDTPPADADLTWRQVGPNRFRSERAPPDSTSVADTNTRGVELAAAQFPFWGRWPINGCVNCHNPQTGDLLPGYGPAPRPPMFSPRDGGARGYGRSEPDRGDKKECDQQLESDSEICGRLWRPRDIAICRASASERYAYCRRPDGTIGFPYLETRGGRRP